MNMTRQLRETTTNDRIEFSELPVFIGRDSTADIQLDDPALPPYQCMIDAWATTARLFGICGMTSLFTSMVVELRRPLCLPATS